MRRVLQAFKPLLCAPVSFCVAEKEEPDVIIVGAGIAGLSAAKYLLENGNKQVKMIEARNRIGGRIYSDHSLDCALDIGASWIQGIENNPIRDYADKKGIEYIHTDFNDYLIYDLRSGRGVIIDDADQIESISDFDLEFKHGNSVEHSILDALDLERSEQMNPFMEMSVRLMITEEFAAEPSEIDGMAYLEADESYGESNVIFPDGYSSIVESVRNDIDSAVIQNGGSFDLSLSSRVTRIYKDPNNPDVISVDYLSNLNGVDSPITHTVSAKRIILTVPLGVLQREQRSLLDLDEVSDEQWRAINSLGFGILSKIYLRMDQVYWPKDRQFFYCITGDDQNSVFLMNFFPLIGEPIILAFYGGSRGWKLAEQESEQHKVEQLVRQLDAMFGSEDGSIGMGNVQGWLLSEWNRDEFTGNGTYSFFKLGADQDARSKMCAPVSVGSGQSTLYFAGEHCSLGRSALTDGAWDSGIEAAKQIIVE